MKTVEDMKVETETLRNIQTEMKLEMKTLECQTMTGKSHQ